MSRLVVSIGHVEFTLANQALYVITVHQDDDKWEVRRTYSDFRQLRDDVSKVMKDSRHNIIDDDCSREFAHALLEIPFPHKKFFGSKSDSVVKERAIELHHFLIKLLLLTHTYRKAQKVLYNDHHQPPPPPDKIGGRQQASVRVFYLLRDFLKPVTIRTMYARDLSHNTSGVTVDEHEDHETAGRQLLRESRMLSMRGSNQTSNRSAPNLLARSSGPSPSQSAQIPTALLSPTARTAAPKNQPEPVPEEYIVNVIPQQQPTRNRSGSKTVNLSVLTKATSAPALKVKVASPPRPPANDRNSDKEHIDVSNGIVPKSPVAAMRKKSSSTERSDVVGHRKSAPAHAIVSSPSSSDSGRSASRSRTKLSSSHHTGDSRKLRPKKSRHKTQSAKTITEAERLSRVSPQLTAQATTIQAQKELEQYLTEYSAIMILRYVDRFISKAATKTPGCYQVSADKKLVIDSERFLEELEETFSDLPANFQDNFKNACGEWYFPKALDAYVQMKWKSFQVKPVKSSTNSTSSSRRQASDSDDSDTDYEYEQSSGGGGYMKPKKQFTSDEADVLQYMIANGTAGRDQMLRLRRQMNENGWNRRAHPVTRARKQKEDEDEWSETDDDDDKTKVGSGDDEKKTVERFQRRQNSLRKDRLSHVVSIGGLV